MPVLRWTLLFSHPIKLYEMNIDLKKIDWEPGKTASQLQLMTLRIRRKSDTDEESSYTTIVDDLQVYTDGTILNPPVIKDLDEATSYIFRFQNNDPAGGSFDKEFITPGAFRTEPLPKSYYPDSELAYEDPMRMFRTNMLPPTSGAYYSLQYTRTDWMGTNYEANLIGECEWAKRADLPGIHLKAAGSGVLLNLDEAFASGINTQYALGLHFYVAAADLPATGPWYLLSFSSFPNGDGVELYVNCNTKKLHWRHNRGAGFQEIVSTNTINTDAWNQVLVFRASDIATSRMWLNSSNTFTGAFTAAGAPVVGQLLGGVSVGSTGAVLSRLYYTTASVDNSIAAKYLQPPYPVGVLAEYYNQNNKYNIPAKNMMTIEDGRIVWTLPPDAPTGRRWFYVEDSGGISNRVEVNILPKAKMLEPVDIDFTSPDGEAPYYFRGLYYFVAKGSDGADGGVSHKHVYMQNGLLAFEAHGDFYDGRSQGFKQDGTPKYHDLAEDPSTPLPWITRVGAVISSKDYYGYGRYIVEARLPEEIGVAPAFWVSNYSKVQPQDPRFEQLLARGLQIRGDQYNGNYYIVDKNEIDMELPSYNASRTFYSFGDMLASNYVIAWAGQKVAVAEDEDPANIGTWQLNNPAAPQQLSSWTKISNEVQHLNQPHKDNIRYSTWIGENGSGEGSWAEDEFVTMLTSIGKNVWDGAFHEFRFDWYADRVEFYVDGEMIQVSRHYVPDVPGRWNIGLLFPSPADRDRPWLVDPYNAWAGQLAAWKYQKMLIKRIAHTPFSDTEAGGTNRLVGETNPFDGLRTYPAPPPD